MPKFFALPDPSTGSPHRNVREYIEALARRHRVPSKVNGLDWWTEAVSRAAGDTVQFDDIGRLLARLRQQRVITGTQMAHLMNYYMKEQEGGDPKADPSKDANVADAVLPHFPVGAEESAQ